MDVPTEAEIAAAVTAARQDGRNLPALLHVADRCLHAGEPDRAVTLSRLAVSLVPDDDRASFHAVRALSGILAAAGHREEALETGTRAVQACPDDPEARLHLGALLAGAERWREARDHLTRHVASPGATALGWRLLSTALHQCGRTVDALRAIDHALALSPTEAEYHVHRACLLAARGRYGDALDELRATAADAPGDARIWRASSGIHEVLHDLPQAVRDAEHAAALDPGDAELAAHLAHVAGLLGGPFPSPEGTAPWAEPQQGGVRRDGVPPGRSLFLPAVATQARVVGALVMREMRTRHGRSRLGYVWAVVEPVGHLLTLGSVFALLNHGAPVAGDSLFLFYLTGLLPFLLFSHVATELLPALAASATVLQLPLVTRVDALLARSLLLLATELLVGAAALGGAALLDAQGMPDDLLAAAAAVAVTWLLGTGVGVVNLVLAEFARSWDVLFAALVRLLYFASGIYYSPFMMPEEVRDALAWNPVLHCVEWFRAGFYRGYDPYWLDKEYALGWAAGALLVGLAAERALRRRVPVSA